MIEGTTKDQYARQTAPPAKNHRHHLTKMGTQSAITWDSQGKMSPKMCTQQCCTHKFSFRMLKDSPSYGRIISQKETANAFTVEHDLWTECGIASAVLNKTLQQKWRENAVGALYMELWTAVLQCFLEKECCKQMLLLLRSEAVMAHFIKVHCPAELKPRSEIGSVRSILNAKMHCRTACRLLQ